MDGRESTHRSSAEQGTPRVYQRRDGGFVVAHDEDGVTFIGTLVVVPDRTALDHFEDALSSARQMLPHGVAVGVADDAFALFDIRVDAALKALGRALKP
jgi:hypothetical protein